MMSIRPENIVAEGVTPEELGFYQPFIKALFTNANPAFLQLLDEASLTAVTANAMGMLEAKSPHEVRVRVGNPRLKTHGWGSPYTTIETTISDRPFLVDSITNELNRLGLELKHVLHPVFKLGRDRNGRLMREANPPRPYREAYQLFLVNPQPAAALGQIEAAVTRVLGDVKKATDDYLEMRRAIGTVAAQLLSAAHQVGQPHAVEIRESLEFLEWLDNGNFVFLGYRQSERVQTSESCILRTVPGRSLGLLDHGKGEVSDNPVPLSNPPDDFAVRLSSYPFVKVSKSQRDATVHRATKMDRIVVKQFDSRLNVVGEHCFLGHFTSHALAAPVREIPILRLRMEKVIKLDGATVASHDYKQIVSILNSFPMDELFWSQPRLLLRDIRTVMAMHQAGEVRVTVRPDPMSNGVLVMVIIPRERYNSKVQKAVQTLLLEVFEAESADFQLCFGEEEQQARLHHFLTPSTALATVDLPALEKRLAQLTRTWQDHLAEVLIGTHGPSLGHRLAANFEHTFSESYIAQASLAMAHHDVENLLARAQAQQIHRVAVLNPSDDNGASSLRIYHDSDSLVLSEILPMLENLGLRVLTHSSHKVSFLRKGQQHTATIDVFGVQNWWSHRPLDHLAQGALIPAVLALLQGGIESQRPLASNGLLSELAMVDVTLEGEGEPADPLARFSQLLRDVETGQVPEQNVGDVLERMLAQLAEATRRHNQWHHPEKSAVQAPLMQPRHSRPRKHPVAKYAVNW